MCDLEIYMFTQEFLNEKDRKKCPFLYNIIKHYKIAKNNKIEFSELKILL